MILLTVILLITFFIVVNQLKSPALKAVKSYYPARQTKKELMMQARQNNQHNQRLF